MLGFLVARNFFCVRAPTSRFTIDARCECDAEVHLLAALQSSPRLMFRAAMIKAVRRKNRDAMSGVSAERNRIWGRPDLAHM